MSKNNTYDSLEKMGQIEWLHSRPETFVGSTEEPTHLFSEVFDNALDEAMNGFADNIQVIIKDDICKISDNGRGFPIDKDKATGKTYPVLACTDLFTSGKFSKEISVYDQSSGLNGVGLTAVTALSEFLLLRSYRNGKQYDYKFVTDFDKHQIADFSVPPVKADGKGTVVMFKPSSKIYTSTLFNIPYIKERIKLVKLITDINIEFKVNGEVIDTSVNKDKLLEYYFDEAKGNDVYPISVKTKDGEELSLYFYYDMEKTDTKIKGSVNLLPVNSGSHITFVKNIFSEVVGGLMPKSNKFSDSDVVSGLRCFVNCRLKKIKFAGQTKKEMALKKERFEVFAKSLSKAIKDKIVNEIGTQLLCERFASIKENKEVKTITKGVKRKKYTDNLFDCLKSGKGTTLFIVEGESAAGSLIKCRDKNYHAVYTLTGKSIPNVTTASVNKILANKTVADLFNVLGKDLSLSELTDTSKVKYEKICITTDPDVDGYHISIMALLFLNKFFPKLIEEGRVILSCIPLYGYYSKKEFVPLYDMNEARKMLDEGKKLMRHKGLGEFDPDELGIILFKESRYIVVSKADMTKIQVMDMDE